MPNRKLSIALIVKNEEEYLAGCIESVLPIADEIVVVDTGSTDSTVSIAERYLCNTLTFNWVNDFSAARNYALMNCEGDFILYLDADERLNKDSYKFIKYALEREYVAAYNCKVISYDLSGSDNIMQYPRLFPNQDNIRFTGKIHEQIEDSIIKAGYSIDESDIVIEHLGYNKDYETLHKKAGRNLTILMAEYSEKKDSYLAYQIGNTLITLNRYNEAMEFYSMANKLGRLSPEYKTLIEIQKADHHLRNSEPLKAFNILNELQREEKNNTLINYKLAIVAQQLGKAEKALRSIHQILINNDVDNQKKISSRISSDKLLIKTSAIFQNTNISQIAGTFIDIIKTLDIEEENKVLYKSLILNNRVDVKLLTNYINNANPAWYQDIYFIIKGLNNGELSVIYKGLNNNNELDEMKLQIAKVYDENGNKDMAINIYKDLINKGIQDVSVYFYLISALLVTNNVREVKDVIAAASNRLTDDKALKSIEAVKQKLKHIL